MNLRGPLMLLLSVLHCAPPAEACINGIDKVPGLFIEEADVHHIGKVIINEEELMDHITATTKTCGIQLTKECNDLVIALLFNKQPGLALELSTQLAALFPASYHTQITHAVALELNGQFEKALKYMDRALEIVPGLHKGSEWIHRNILLQRIAGNVHVTPASLIGMDLRAQGGLSLPEGNDAKKLLEQVHYQVSDRHYFTPEQDPLYGALLFAYADLLHLNRYRTVAKEFYALADSYGYRPVDEVQQSIMGEARTAASVPSTTALDVGKPQLAPMDLAIALSIALLALGAIILWAVKGRNS